MANKYPHELSGQSIDLNDIIVVQNGVSGMVGKNTIQELKDFIASSLGAGVTEVHVGTTAPTNGEKLWLDTTANPAVLKLDPNQDGNWADAVSASGATNLTFTRNATTVTVLSDTGTDVVLPSATITQAGIMSAADKGVLTDLAPLADNVTQLEALALASQVDEVLTHSPAVNADVADNTAGDIVQDSNGVQYIVVNKGGTLTPLPLNDSGALLVSANPNTLSITSGISSGQIVVDTSTSPDTSYVYNDSGEFLEIGATGSLPVLPSATPASGTVTYPTVASAPTTSTVGTVGKLTKNGTSCYIMTNYTAGTPSLPVGPFSILGTTGTSPYSITIDSSGNIYTANQSSNNVSKITPAGVSTIIGTTGTSPLGITIDSSGNIYTANYSSNNVSKSSNDGSGSPESYTWQTLNPCPTTTATINTVAPTANDDTGDGYIVGSTWIQTNAGGTSVVAVFRATSVSAGSATWVDVTTLNDTTYTAGGVYTVGDRKQLTITWNGTSWDMDWGNVI